MASDDKRCQTNFWLIQSKIHLCQVNIVIPVFNRLDLVRQCLSSVLAAQTEIEYQITVVDDASTEPEVSSYLWELATRQEIVLITNTFNCGFVRSVNKGLTSSAGMDVLLLNSDTIVYDHWLDRLVAVALLDSKIATVNPLTSQNGSHISCYPDSHWHEAEQLELNDAELNQIAGEVSSRRFTYVHTTVGFCMFIKRKVIKDIGVFDARYFLFAYGEESDFCLQGGKARLASCRLWRCLRHAFWRRVIWPKKKNN